MREIVSPLSGPFTTFGQTPIDFYKVGAYRPELAYSFYNEYYRKGRQPVNFLQAIDHSATSNATMTGDYGPELVTNGDFSNGSTGWTLGSEWSVSNGVASFADSAANSDLTQVVDLPAGTYEATFRITEGTNPYFAFFEQGGADNFLSYASYPIGVHKVILTIPSDATGFRINGSYFLGSSFGITDISVREVPKIQWRPHNLLTYSEDFSASAWSKTATTVTANAAVAPDGTQTADEISHTSTSAEFRQTPTTVSGAGYVNGIFIKYIDHQWFRINLDGTSFWFDVQNGVIGTDNTSGASVTALSDDWWYVTAPITAPDTSFSLLYYMVSANNSTTEVSGTSAYIWGAHLYRSDLGGMADVPADARVIPTATKYVRTAGRVIGSELVTNGTFDSDVSGWTDESGSTTVWSSGAANQSTTVSGQKAYQAITCEVGKVYQVSATFSNATARADLWVHSSVGAGTALALEEYVASGTMQGSFVATAETMYVQFGAGTTAPQSVTFDNISVKEIDVNPASARYLPRRGHHVYNGSQWVNKGLLHESEARTNFIDESEASGLGVVRATTTAGSSVWIDGSSTMVKVVENTDTNSHAAYENPVGTFADNTVYTFSTYLKAGERSWAKLGIKKKTSAIAGAWFDLSGGVVGTIEAGASSATIEDCGNGIYRCSVSVDLETGANAQQTFIYTAIADNSLSYTGDGSSGLECYGLQFELGSTPSSYIPTSGSTVTRAAETLTIPAANLPWPDPVYVTNTELVTNGTFDTDTDWTKGTGWTISGGVATSDGSQTATSDLSQAIGNTVSIGQRFAVTYTVSGYSAGIVRSVFGNDSGSSVTANGTYTDYYTVTTTSSNFKIRASLDFVGSVDNISVKEINPLALSIQMSGEMTYADTGGFPEVYLIQWYANSSNHIDDFIGANLGTGQFRVRQNDGGTLDQSIQADIDYFTPGINVPFNISSRHGSTFINGAVDGVALTEDTTPVGLPDLSSIDLNLGHDFMGTIDTFRVWAEDIGNTGIAEATEPSEDATLFLSFDGTETSYIDFEWSE